MGRFIAIVDAVSVTVAAGLAGAMIVRLAMCGTDLVALPFALGLGLGFLAADFVSGVVHWFCDTYFTPRTLLIGPIFIAPFRDHHVDPSALARHGVFERNGNNCLLSIPLLLLAISIFEPGIAAHARQLAIGGFVCAVSLTLCMTNQVHAWAHGAAAPRIVGALQRAGILIAPACHARHHCGGRTYAVVSGWSNVVLDRMLARIESLLEGFGLHASDARKSTQ